MTPLLLDVLLPPTLLLSAFILYARSRAPSKAPVPPTSASLPSLLHALTTTHLRLLPTPSRHAFKYPLLYYGLDLEDLELRRLDLSTGRICAFAYEPVEKARSSSSSFKVTRIRETGYLAPEVPYLDAPSSDGLVSTQPLRSKLLSVISSRLSLAACEVESKAGRIYLVTMPSFLGFEGINPLSVWFVYSPVDSKEQGALWTVVLEVHNTFGERHVYVLECGRDEDSPPPIGYTHRWTFPRSFHVSPFNSRDGYYTLSLVPPFARSTSPSPTPQPLSISLLLLTPSRAPKLHARLATTPSRDPLALTSRNVLTQTLLVFPLALLATTPRIMWNAGILAFKKGLRVYARPNPIGKAAAGESEGDVTSEGETSSDDNGSASSPMDLKAERWGEVGTQLGSVPGGLVWIAPSSSELHAQDVTVAFLRRRLDELRLEDPTRKISVHIVPSDPSQPTLRLSPALERTGATANPCSTSLLVLSPVSLQAFSLLLLSPTSSHAIATLSRPDPHTILHISSPSLFTLIFTPPAPTPSRPACSGHAYTLARFLRRRNPLSPPSVRALSESSTAAPPHWTEAAPGSMSTRTALGMAKTILAEWAEESAMSWLGVRFVEKGEGWRASWRTSGRGAEGRE